MKSTTILFVFMILFVNQTFAQTTITKIKAPNKNYYITTKINYPIAGTYQYENISEPIVILNLDGTGVFQNSDLSKKEIIWGLECTEEGFLRFKDGFNSAAYTIWFRNKDNQTNIDFEEINDWKKVEFSIHFNTNKMYIMGERVKEFVR